MRWPLLTLAGLIACQDRKPPPPPPPAPPPGDAATARADLELLLAGNAPQQLLRYHLAAGTHTTSELRYDLDIRSDGKPGPLPTLVVALDTLVDRVRPDGTAQLRMTVQRTAVRGRPGAPADELVRKEAAALAGVVISLALAPDGEISELSVAAGGALSEAARSQLDRLTQSLAHVAPRLPHAPVGVGASWRARSELPEGGIRATTDITYLLTARTGDAIEFTGHALTRGTPQTITQDGTTVEVTETAGEAESHGSIDLARYAFAVTASSRFRTVMNVTAPAGTPGSGPGTIEIATQLSVAAPAVEAGSADAGPTADQGAHSAP